MNEPTPGVMHPVDRAFYDLTVKQRNAAWREVERLRAENSTLRAALDAAQLRSIEASNPGIDMGIVEDAREPDDEDTARSSEAIQCCCTRTASSRHGTSWHGTEDGATTAR
jgi:hypothetical protein